MQISILQHEKHCQNKKLSATKRRWNVGLFLHYYQTRQLNFTSLSLPRILIDRIQRIQNSAARLITGSRKYEHITPRLKQLHWLPIDERIKYKILLLTFKTLNDLAPIYIGDMLCKYAPSRRFSASSNKLLQVPSAKLKTNGERTFLFAAPKLWNSLPNLIRHCSSLESFKTEIKTFLNSDFIEHLHLYTWF